MNEFGPARIKYEPTRYFIVDFLDKNEFLAFVKEIDDERSPIMQMSGDAKDYFGFDAWNPDTVNQVLYVLAFQVMIIRYFDLKEEGEEAGKENH